MIQVTNQIMQIMSNKQLLGVRCLENLSLKFLPTKENAKYPTLLQ